MQGLIEELQNVQKEITALKTSSLQDPAADPGDSNSVDQLTMRSSLSVLTQRMATIYMKVSGKQQQMEVEVLQCHSYH